jgi:Spy/CpxP family protein refolding chaperone
VNKMKPVIQKTVLSLAVALFSVLSFFAQERPEPGYGEGGQARRQNDARPNIMRQLGLSREQMQQLREYNQLRRPTMEAAQLRFREANRRLDEAIYAHQLNEAEVHERIKEVQLSQAELIKLRSMSELSIRKILTPDQLNRFRKLRQRFDEGNPRPGRQGMGMPRSPGGPLPRQE